MSSDQPRARRVGRPMTAGQHTTCPRCQTPIRPGDLIQRRLTADGTHESVHALCDEGDQ